MCNNHTLEKEIARFTSENASKRHLPLWMVPKIGVASTRLGNSDSDENNCASEKEALAKATDLTACAGTALKRKAGTVHKRGASRRKSYSHAESEVKGIRKLSEQDGSSGNNATQKHKKKMNRSKVRVPNSSSKKSQIVEDPNRGNFEVNSVQASSDDDTELTIEDLMAIAEEYVRDFENRKQQKASSSPCESVKQFPATSEFGNSFNSHCERKRSSTPVKEGLYSSTSNKTGEFVATETSVPGDPAQDMLELLLGPFMKKTLEEERNKCIVESVEFTHEPTRKS